ncbi:MAG: hypothetical protein E5X67_29900 [Mesorhizobium sp.]|uniref:hypothetical protein n=1 Tax=Mesorhizobium sp. TaxID=1871066 RepID=UPI0011F53394|nr:hypothetical protein [Mesorhizobium sp.]TIP24262.1 MAG: hypothetical protein E5X67_29900 [Mesorhizobium sp.]
MNRIAGFTIFAAVIYFAFFGDRFYLVPTYEIGLRPFAERMPATFALSGREVECEMRAAELRRAEMTRFAQCQAVPLWRHWLNLALQRGA